MSPTFYYIVSSLPSKLLWLFAIALTLSGFSFAEGQERPWHGPQVVERSDGHLIIINKTEIPTFHKINTVQGYFTQIHLDGYINNYDPGMPELPLMNKMIEVPLGAEVIVRILSYDSTLINLNEMGFPDVVIPSQPSVLKSDTVRRRHLILLRDSYRRDEFQGRAMAEYNDAGVMRGVRLGMITIRPFRYNPVKNQLVFLNNIMFEVNFIHADMDGTRKTKNRLHSPVFESTFQKVLTLAPPTKSGSQGVPIKYVILADPMFHDVLQPFIRWKMRKGFRVVELYKGDPGVGSTVEECKSALQTLYDNGSETDPAPSYLLIVGDVAQIPPSYDGSHVSDLYYATYDGAGDFVPDLFYGRLSANTVEELVPQLDKTLMYEQYLFPDPSFLGKAVMIAGVDGTYAPVQGNGQINYGTNYYINDAHGIQSYTYLYPESGSKTAEIKEHISEGVGFVNYTGHGTADRWLNPLLTSADIAGFHNSGKYPLMVGNGCETNRFEVTTCFGEALLRAVDKGAVGYIGGSNDSYWDEDYYWAVGVGPLVANPLYEQTTLGAFDRTFHDHGEPIGEWYDAQGQMIFAGNLSVMEGSPGRAKYYWEIYHLMGDPSLMIYYGVPPAMLPEYPDTIPPGTEVVNITSEPYAYVALSDSGCLLDARMAGDNGVASLHLSSDLQADTLVVVITGKNLQPYMGHMILGPVSSPYLTAGPLLVSDPAGNHNSKPDYGEQIGLGFPLSNLGEQPAPQVKAVLSTIDPYIKMVDSTETAGDVESKQSLLLNPAFIGQISDTVPDQHHVPLVITLSDANGGEWKVYEELVIQAPLPKIISIVINDSIAGNHNHRYDPGEKVHLSITACNAGHSDMGNGSLTLESACPFVHWVDSVADFADFIAGDTVETLFNFLLDKNAPAGTRVDIRASLTSGLFHDQIDRTRLAGIVYEDFESGSLSYLPWINDKAKPWVIDPGESEEGKYSLRSGTITHSQSTQCTLELYFPTEGTLSFAKKVSSELNFDFLRFYINGIKKGEWSGESPWSVEKFPVGKGKQTLVWKYSKDGNTSHGLDHGWIDELYFPGAIYLTTVQDSIYDAVGNMDGSLNPGEEGTMILAIHNPGITGSTNVTAKVIGTDSSLVISADPHLFSGTVTLNDTLLYCPFDFSVAEWAQDKREAVVLFTLTDSTRGSWTYYTSLTIRTAAYTVSHIIMDDSVNGNGNNRAEEGETFTINACIVNTGQLTGTQVPCQLVIDPQYRPYLHQIDSTQVIGSLDPGDTARVEFSFFINSIPDSGIFVPLLITAGPPANVAEKMISFPLGYVYEDFETGDLSRFHWLNDQSNPWLITSSDIYEGSYSLRSASVGNSKTTSVMLRINVTREDSLRFFAVVSSERYYDFLKFYLDDAVVVSWSGETGWTRYSCLLKEGCHSLRWTYSKDGSISQGKDMAMIDFIIFPPFKLCPVSAGVSEITSPASSPFLTNSETVRIRVINQSSDTLSQIPVSYVIDEQAPVNEILAGKVAPGKKMDYAFTTKADFSANGSYTLKAYTSCPGDTVFADDTCTLSIRKQEYPDLSITSLEKPVDDSSFGRYETIEVKVSNMGNTSFSNIPLYYRLNSLAQVSENLPGPLALGQTIVFTFTTLADMYAINTYVIKVYGDVPADANHANDTLVATLVNQVPDAIDIPEGIHDFSLFPNPFIDHLNLHFSGEKEGQLTISIFLPSGVKVAEKTLPVSHGNNYHTLYLRNLEPGMYILEIRDRERVLVRKIFKE